MHQKNERRCVACREEKNQNEMIRVARINNEYVLDLNNKLDGRGAYICRNKNCISMAIKKRLLNKSFKANVSNNIYEKLGEYEQNS